MSKMLNFSLPFNHTISAHYLNSETNSELDLTWELCTDSAHPLGVSIESSLGLQARVIQIIPVILDAKSLPFHLQSSGPTPRKIYADQIDLELIASSQLDASCLVWVPNGSTISGEFIFKVKKRLDRELRAGVMIRAVSLDGSTVVRAHQRKNMPYLSIDLDKENLVGSISGSPELIHKPHTGLVTALDVLPSRTTHIRWALSAAADAPAALADCTKWLLNDWQPDAKRSELNQSAVRSLFKSEMSDLDECLYITQNQAERFMVPVSDHITFSTLLSSRQPDDPSYSSPNESVNQRSLTIWELYHFCSHIASVGQMEKVWGMVRNFILLQRGDGHIDFQPDLHGGWSHVLAAPLLAGCIAKLHKTSPNLPAVREAYPILKKFIGNWLNNDHDPDQDRLPVWQNSTQSGWAENPIFNISSGCPTWSVESPGLGALIFSELDSLSHLARELGFRDESDTYSRLSLEVKSAVMGCWDHKIKCFRYRDTDSHETTKGSRLSRATGPGSFPIEREFEKPTRLRLSLELKKTSTDPIEVQLQGYRDDGEHVIERIPVHPVNWMSSTGSITSRQLYKRVTSLAISGISEKDPWNLAVPDLTQLDLSLFLPLWAGIPDPQTARQMIEQCLLPTWETTYPYGMGMLPAVTAHGKATAADRQVNPVVLCMVLNGLFKYGYRAEASRLVLGLMKAIINHIKQTGGFSEGWDGITSNPLGRQNHLLGLAPIALYLQSIGVEIHNAAEAAIIAENFTGQTIDLIYQDLHITRGNRDAQLTFRNEPPVSISGVENRLISWKKTTGGA